MAGSGRTLAFFDSHSRSWQVRLELPVAAAAAVRDGTFSVMEAGMCEDLARAITQAEENNQWQTAHSSDGESTIVYTGGKRFVCPECKAGLALFTKKMDAEYGETFTCTNCRAEFQGVH